jgi:hypothetical protein
LPPNLIAKEPLLADWLERVAEDPNANVLPSVNDDEL